MSRVGRGLISSDDATGAVTLPSAPDILPMSQGGFGVDVSSKTGAVHQYAGVFGWESGTVFVDAMGADPTGVADSSVAVQAAIDADYRRVVFNPNGTYLFNTAVTIPSLPDANLTDVGREIDGQGCTVVGANGIASCFKLTQAVWPNNHKYTKFHDFLFDGTVTDAFVLFETGYSWQNQFYNIRAALGASSNSVIRFHNVESASFPGNFYVHNIASNGQKYTLHFSKAVTALGNFDDFHVHDILGGAYIEHAAAIRIDVGCNVQYSNFHDILSGGPHAINAQDADLVKCKINRIYLEIPAHTVGSPTAWTDNWGIAGTLSDCDVDTIWGAIANRTDHPGMHMVYAHVYRTTVRNVGIYCTEDYALGTNDAAFPYAVAYYPAIYLFAGNNFTFDFPIAFLTNGVYLGTITSAKYLGGTYPRIENVTNTMHASVCRDGMIFNYGQGAAATITLPIPGIGMSIRFVMSTVGFAYHIKADAASRIYLNGTALDDGDKVSNAVPAVGDSIRFVAFPTTYVSGPDYVYDWIATTEAGTWIDGGA